MFAANLLGVTGMLGTAVSVGALAGNWWWSVLLASLFAIVVCVVAGLNAALDVDHVDYQVVEHQIEQDAGPVVTPAAAPVPATARAA